MVPSTGLQFSQGPLNECMGPDNDSIKVACMSMVRELPITSRIARKQQSYWALLGFIGAYSLYTGIYTGAGRLTSHADKHHLDKQERIDKQEDLQAMRFDKQ